MKYFLMLLLAFTFTGSMLAQTITNQTGSFTVSETAFTETSNITQYNAHEAAKGTTLGTIDIETGSLLSGTTLAGGVFDSTYSSVQIVADAALAAEVSDGNTLLFSGAFYGPITWQVIRTLGPNTYYQLSGNVVGKNFNGKTVTGTVVENVYFVGVTPIAQIGTVVLTRE